MRSGSAGWHTVIYVLVFLDGREQSPARWRPLVVQQVGGVRGHARVTQHIVQDYLGRRAVLVDDRGADVRHILTLKEERGQRRLETLPVRQTRDTYITYQVDGQGKSHVIQTNSGLDTRHTD